MPTCSVAASEIAPPAAASLGGRAHQCVAGRSWQAACSIRALHRHACSFAVRSLQHRMYPYAGKILLAAPSLTVERTCRGSTIRAPHALPCRPTSLADYQSAVGFSACLHRRRGQCRRFSGRAHKHVAHDWHDHQFRDRAGQAHLLKPCRRACWHASSSRPGQAAALQFAAGDVPCSPAGWWVLQVPSMSASSGSCRSQRFSSRWRCRYCFRTCVIRSACALSGYALDPLSRVAARLVRVPANRSLDLFGPVFSADIYPSCSRNRR